MLTLYNEEKTDAEIREFLNRYVEEINANKHDRYHVIMSMIPKNLGKILDYGCGWGHYSVGSRDKGNVVEAIDISDNSIGICDLMWDDKRDLAFKAQTIREYNSDTFDLVLSSQVIEHVHNVGNYLSEINRVLKINGLLVISLPNIMNPRFIFPMLKNNMEERLMRYNQDILENYDKSTTHINAWDPLHFTALLSSMGFELLRYVPAEGLALPLIKVLPSYVYLNGKRLKNFSYTMVFQFKKVREQYVSCDQ